jgi:predicted phosphodiesterase
MLLIGDVHGKTKQYHDLIKTKSPDSSIQLGDFGFKEKHDWFLENMDTTKHKICFGNHDYIPYNNLQHSCGNFSFNEEYNLFTIRGAKSTDPENRLVSYTIFPDEELNYIEWNDCLDLYSLKKPDIVVSHECPELVKKSQFKYFDKQGYKNPTADWLQACLEIHQPKLWVFGHHHKSLDVRLGGVRFVCLKELESFEILKTDIL